MTNGTVSVIIPCYNSSRFIRKTIESALGQVYKPLEIIAVNDGSRDETRSILEEYLPNIKILSHPGNSNLGVGASLNLGVQEAKGDLIAFLDHDDLWHINKLMEQVEIFDKNEEVGVVYTNVSVIDEDDKKLFEIYTNGFHELSKPEELLLKCYIMTASSVMVRRKLFDQIGLFRTDIQAADYDVWIRLIEKAIFFYLPKCLASHRKHPDQLSSRRRIWEDGVKILKEACKRYPYGANLKRKRMAVLYYRFGEYDWIHNDYFRSMKNMLLAGLLDPTRVLNYILKRKAS